MADSEFDIILNTEPEMILTMDAPAQGVSNYEQLRNLPSINGVTLIGEKSGEDLIHMVSTTTNGLMYAEDKEKLDTIERNAKPNVQSDWAEDDVNHDGYILHKPGLATKTTDGLLSAADKVKLDTAYRQIEELASAVTIKRYGASGYTNEDPTLTRLFDAVGMTANPGTDEDTEVINDFDAVPLFARRKCVGHWEAGDGKAVFVVEAYYGDPDYAEDGSKGDYVAVDCPPAYVYISDDMDIRVVSSYKISDKWQPFACLASKEDPTVCREHTYLPVYALALDENGHAVSLPGYANRQGSYSTLLSDCKKYSNADVTAYAHLQPADVEFYEETLMTIEYANHDMQEIMMGACNLRHTAGDRCQVFDATHLLCSNYNVARAVGSYVTVNDASHTDYAVGDYPSHKIISSIRCDAEGNEDASGTRQLLEVEELIDRDLQAGVDYMIVSRAFITGSCDSVKTPSGSPVSNTDGYHPMRYRWRENVYGNQWRTTMDLFDIRVEDEGSDPATYHLTWHKLLDPDTWTAGNPNTATISEDPRFAQLSVITETENYKNGYQTAQEADPNYPQVLIPVVGTGGGSTKFNGNYAYLALSHVYRAVRLGGSEDNGRYAGPGAVSGNSSPSNSYAYFGGALYFSH